MESPQLKGPAWLQVVIGVGVLIAAVWWLHSPTVPGMNVIERQVANDAVEKYEIVKRRGAQFELCAHAGMVAAAWLQAKDEAQYAKWREIERADCGKVGAR